MVTRLLRRLVYLLRQRRADEDLAEEIRSHRELAGRPIGNILQAREEARAVWVAPWLDGLWQDIRHAVRSLRRSPALVVVSALSLGLGIGINALLYMAVTAVYEHQPSLTDPASVVGVEPGNNRQFSYPAFSDLERSRIFADVAGFRTATLNLGSGTATRPVGIMNVTAGFFTTLGVNAALGRTFSRADAAAETDPRVVVVTNSFWRNRLGGDPSAVGQTLTLSGQPFVIVGVLGPDYRSVSGWVAPQLYVPASRLTLRLIDDRGSPTLSVIARLRPQGTLAAAQDSVTSLGAALEREYPQRAEGMGRPAAVYPAGELQFRGTPFQFRMLAPLTLTVSALVLFIACINVTGLLLARAAGQRREIAVRVAVGAGRARVMQTMLVEGFVLVMAGALVGLPIAFVLDRIPLPTGLSWIQDTMTLDGRLVPFALVVMVVATLVCALVPAIRATQARVIAEARQAGDTSTPRPRLRQALVSTQMALSLVLLMGAILAIRSQQHIANVDVGFDLNSGVVARFGLDVTQYPGVERARLADRMLEHVRHIPGVTSAAAASLVPLGGDSLANAFHPAGRTDVPGTRPSSFSVGPGYFTTLGIPLLRGRDFNDGDTDGADVVAVVNETFARTHFRTVDAVGKQVATAGKPDAVVVGVVRDHRIGTIGETPRSIVYFAFAQVPDRLIIHARTSGDPESIVDAMQAAAADTDPTVPVTVETLERAASIELTMRRAGTVLMGSMGVVGLLLAMVGLYGVMSYLAASRTREIGIRMVLGASTTRIRQEMFRRACRLVGAGALVGALASAVTMPFLATFLAGVSPFDPLAFAGAAGILVLVGLAATYGPIRRSSHTDPIHALRQL